MIKQTFLLLCKFFSICLLLLYFPPKITAQFNCTYDCSNNDFSHNIVNCGCFHYDPCLLRFIPLSVSQRIAAADLAPGLQYFGRSIHGTMDMNNDGLVDLAVGSLGAAVLLWLVFHPVNNTVVKNIKDSYCSYSCNSRRRAQLYK